MGAIFVLCCLSIAFMPSLFIFRHFVAPDPLRIVLFVLGAFFWLCSLLLAAVFFTAFGVPFLLLAVFFSILCQEAARFLYFLLLYKAQSGLARVMAADAGRTGTASSMRLLYSSRHILAIVCGLGMGTAAALFLLVNVLADYGDDGVVGLPAAVAAVGTNASSSFSSPLPSSAALSRNAVGSSSSVSSAQPLLFAVADVEVDDQQQQHNNDHQLRYVDAFFPLYYSLSCALLTLFHVVWTVCGWDAFHRYFYKIGPPSAWMTTIVLTLLSHCANNVMSLFLSSSPFVVVMLQLLLLLLCFLYAYALIKHRC